MSSFICSPEHFNSIEASLINLILNTHGNQAEWHLPYSQKEQFPAIAYGGSQYRNREAVKHEVRAYVDYLRKLNVLTVNFQYARHNVGTLDQQIADDMAVAYDRTKSKVLKPVELYHALRCLRYQIEFEHLEDTGFDTPELVAGYKFLEDAINITACYIAERVENNGNQWEVRI